MPLVDQLTIEELCRARDRWKSFKELAISFGDALGGMVGANIAGFPSMAETLRTEDVDVEGAGNFFRREGFGRANDQVSGVVHHDIKSSVLFIDCFDGAVGGVL